MNEVAIEVFSQVLSGAEIGERLGIKPDAVIEKGSPRGGSPILKQESHAWIIRSSAPPDVGIANHLEDLRRRLSGLEDRFGALPAECSTQCSIVVHAASEPALNFSAAAVSWLCRLGASLDIDLYISAG
jgi:uncharacterized protein DUF4279